MRVVVPFTDLRPETVEALDASGYPWEAVSVKFSDYAYFELVAQLWREQQDFGIVEHDIKVGSDTLSGMETCVELWCAAPYPYLNGTYAGLGCARFRSQLMVEIPELMDEVALMGNDDHPPRHWCVVDGFMQIRLALRGYSSHRHGEVVNLGGLRPAHGCHG